MVLYWLDKGAAYGQLDPTTHVGRELRALGGVDTLHSLDWSDFALR